MQHYALFRLQVVKMPSGCYPVTRRGAALALIHYVYGIKNAALLRATFMPDLNFERCKDKKFPVKLYRFTGNFRIF